MCLDLPVHPENLQAKSRASCRLATLSNKSSIYDDSLMEGATLGWSPWRRSATRSLASMAIAPAGCFPMFTLVMHHISPGSRDFKSRPMNICMCCSNSSMRKWIMHLIDVPREARRTSTERTYKYWSRIGTISQTGIKKNPLLICLLLKTIWTGVVVDFCTA